MRPERLEELARANRIADVVLPIAALLPLPQLTLGRDAAARFRTGSLLEVGDAAPGRYVILDDAGDLLGIGSVTDHRLHPHKVVAYDAAVAAG